jgi:hypothetical protein
MEDPTEPGLEAVAFAQVAELSPSRQRSVMGGILRITSIAEHERRKPIGVIEGTLVHEAGESLRPSGVLQLVRWNHDSRDIASDHALPTFEGAETFNHGSMSE